MAKLYTCLLVAAVATAMPAAAGATMAQAGGAVIAQDMGKPDAAKKDKLVCKRDRDFDTGSHLRGPKKTCLRQSQWKEREDSAERFMRSVDERSRLGDIDPPGMSPQ